MVDIITWPYPKLMQTKYHTFIMTKQAGGSLVLSTIRLVNGTWASTPVLTITSPILSNTWDIADFGPYFILAMQNKVGTNHTVNSYMMHLDSNLLIPMTPLQCGTLCNFRGQLMCGNISSTNPYWETLSSNGIVWSGIGVMEFDPLIEKTSGFREVFFPNVSTNKARIHKIMPLASTVIVYSDSGNVVLTPGSVNNSYVFGEEVLDGLGIRSGNHIAGNEIIHGFIDLKYEFWTMTAKDGMNKLGYREFIEPIVSHANDTIVSYLPHYHRFYISNGIETLVINSHGAYTTHQLVSGVAAGNEGTMYGTFDETIDTEGRTFSDIMDWGSRDIKSIETIVAGIRLGADATAQFCVDWRMNNKGSFNRSTWKPTGPTGEAFIGVSAAEFKLGVKIDDPAGAELTYILPAVKFLDRKFRRGIAPGATRYNEAVQL